MSVIARTNSTIVACLLPAIILLPCAGCRHSGSPASPYLNKFLLRRSPSGAYEATFYNFGRGDASGFLGATVTHPMYVNVRPTRSPFDPERGQVFAMRHGYRLGLVWESERRLRVEYTSSARVEFTVSRQEGVFVVFKPVPQARLPEPYPALRPPLE